MFHAGTKYHLVMTNIAMENPQNKWRFLAGKIIYFYGPSKNHGYVSHNQRVTINPLRVCLKIVDPRKNPLLYQHVPGILAGNSLVIHW